MKNYVAAILLTTALAGCSTPQNVTTETPTQKPFAFETTQSVTLEVSAFALGGPVKGAPVTVFQGFNADGSVRGVQQKIMDFHSHLFLFSSIV